MNGELIAIILDPSYGSQLNRFARQYPVWIVDTPANRGLVERERTAGQDVTTFKVEDPNDRFGNFLGIVDAVELHHGPYSQAPPYRSMLIVGARGDDWAERLNAAGFVNIRRVDEGFVVDVADHEPAARP